MFVSAKVGDLVRYVRTDEQWRREFVLVGMIGDVGIILEINDIMTYKRVLVMFSKGILWIWQQDLEIL
jgi:hypothetical protein